MLEKILEINQQMKDVRQELKVLETESREKLKVLRERRDRIVDNLKPSDLKPEKKKIGRPKKKVVKKKEPPATKKASDKDLLEKLQKELEVPKNAEVFMRDTALTQLGHEVTYHVKDDNKWIGIEFDALKAGDVFMVRHFETGKDASTTVITVHGVKSDKDGHRQLWVTY